MADQTLPNVGPHIRNLSENRMSAGFGHKRFQCRMCHRAFGKSDHLSRHERSHTKSRPFSCPNCAKSFGRQDVLARHAKLHAVPPTAPISATGYMSITSQTPSSGHGDEGVTASPAMLARSPNVQQNVQQRADESGFARSQPWTDSGDLLDLLMTDDNSTWPGTLLDTLPIMHFQPSAFQYPRSPYSTSTPAHQNIDHISPGQHAMNQMSSLIADLSSRLTAEVQSTGITSIFLDTCLHVFFDKFNPSFPILNKATFSVAESSYPLLLNIIALGSLFVGAKEAIPKGEALWRLAHTAVATSWQTLMATRGPRDKCNGVQLVLTALLGQIYAILSKNASLRMTSQTFHSLGFYWARQCGMFDTGNASEDELPRPDSTENDKVEIWKTWIAKEIQCRAILGHFVLDGQISQLSGHAACVRHVTNCLLTPASDTAFAAATVEEWIVEMRKQTQPLHSFREIFLSLSSGGKHQLTKSLSHFSIRVVLEGLQSLTSEIQGIDGPAIATQPKSEIVSALLVLYDERLSFSGHACVEDLELLVRWHTICLDLATPSTTLCQRLCTFAGIEQHLYGGTRYTDSTGDLHAWSDSIGGRRALLHALAIQDIIEKLPLGRSNAIHLPAALFAAATIYSARCIAGIPSIATPTNIRWDGVWAGVTSNVDSPYNDPIWGANLGRFLENKTMRTSAGSQERNLIYNLNSIQMLLGSISSHWGVLHTMDTILEKWITIANASK